MPQEQLAAMRDTRSKTLRMLRDLTQTQYDFRKQPDRWSAGEIADHLVKSNRMYLGEIQRLIDLKRSGRKPEIRVSLTDMQFQLPLVPGFLLPLAEVPVGVFNCLLPSMVREAFLRSPLIPAQSPPVLRPVGGRGRESLLADLEKSMEESEQLFSRNRDLDFGEFRYYHPLFGFNGVDGILRLMVSHERRHQVQLGAVLKDLPGGE